MRKLIQKRSWQLTIILLAMVGSRLVPDASAQYAPPANNRVDLNFNYGWSFHKGDVSGAQNVGFTEDATWLPVSLPHTWNDLDRYREWISTNTLYTPTTGPVQPPSDYPDPAYGQAPPNDPVLGTSGAYYGIGWYRKHFTLDASYAGRKVIAEFTGISRCAHFYVNGQDVAYLPGTTTANTIQLPAITGINGDTTLPAETLNCGYHENGIGPCGVDITPYLNPAGQDNLIAVWVTNDFNYTTQEYGTTLPYGQPFNLNFGGLQRDAVLHVSDPLRQTLPLYRNLGTVGTYAYTANVDTLNKTADLTVTSEVKNDYTVDKTATLDTVLVDASGNQIGATVTTAAQTIKAGTKATFTTAASLTGVHFWDVTYPYLYQVYTILKVGGTVVDVNKIPLGVHKWKFGSTIGLELNGHPIYLNGYAPRTTMEWPAVGIPPDWMVEYDFNLIKQSGGNFVRPMHSAPRKVQVDAADKLGVVMVCPATATENDETVSTNWTQKVADMRDVCVYFRNNPSVYFWEGNNGDLSATHMQNMMDITAQFDPGNVNITPGRDYRDNTRLIGTRAAGTGSAATARQFSSPIESNVRDADRPIWDAEYARGECPRRVWDNYTPMLNPFWDGKNPDPTPVQGSVATFGDTTHKYIIGGFGYISNLYYEQTAGDNPLVTTVPQGQSGINWDAGSGINDYLALIPNGTNSDGSTNYANGYYRLMNSEELMIENTAKYFGRYENSVFVQPAATSAASGVTIGGAKIIWADSVTDGRLKIVDVARVSGAVDGARLPKETFYGMRVAQNDANGVPDIYIAGHWNYPAGTVKTMYVVSNTSQVKLQTYDSNGNLLKDYGFGTSKFFPAGILSPGSDQVNKYVFAFNNVAFQPGYIQAQGYNDGSTAPVIQTSLTDPVHPSLKTAGDPASIRITPITGPQGWLADGEDIVMFDAEVIDASGQRCPTYEDKVTFTASAAATGTFLGGYNTGVRYSTNINHLTTYPLNIEGGINRVFARSTRTAGTFTLSAAGTFINAAGKTINLSSNVASVASTVFPVTNGLTTAAPQKYVVTLGTEPTPVAEGTAPPPPSNAPQPAPTSNVQGLAYSGTHQNQAMLVENAQPGAKAYVDSNTITLPSALPGYLIGGEYIQPFLADSNAAPATDQYQFNVSRYSYLYLMLDAANGMPNHDGNASYQWAKQAETVQLNGRTMNIYKSILQAPYTPVFLASNNYQNAAPGFDGRSNMYLVFIASAEEQLQAPSPTDTITASSSQTSATQPSAAIDGNVSTHWNASSGSFPQTITLVLPKPVNIGGYDINWTSNSSKYYQYLIEVSSTGADGTWLKSLDQSSNVTLGDYEYRVPAPLVQNSANVQYVRITVSDASGGAYAAINEITVNGVLTSTADTQPPVITSSLSPISGQGGYAITPYQITASGSPTGYAAQGLPSGFTLNALTGVISGTTLQGGTYPVTITAINGAGAGSAVLTFNIANPPPVPVITSATTYPPAGTTIPAGSAIVAANTYTATATNTQYTPFKYLATFPANLALGISATTGKITGTPKYPGTFTIALSASNPGGTGPVTNLTYTVTPTGTPPTITSAGTASAYLGTAYTATSGIYTITGSGTPTLFGVSAPSGGSLPSWLKINTSTGVLYGTPDALGNYPVVVSASNAGGTATANVTLSVVRNPSAPVITSDLSPLTWHVGTTYSYTITATNSPTAYSATPLPADVTLKGNVFSGAPTTIGTTTTTLKATNASGYDTQTLTINVLAAVIKPVLSGPINAVGSVGAPFSCQYTATNVPTGYTFTAASGTSLPSWMKLDTVNGTLSGVPDAVGTTNLTVTAYNDGGTSNSVALSIVISAAGSDVNLALNKAVVTSSLAIAGNLKEYAVDGSTVTRWESPHDDTEWIYVNLGAVYTIHSVALNWQQGAVGGNYTVEISPTGADGSWTNYVPAIVGNTKSGVLTYTATAQAQYVRMNGTKRAGIYGYSLFEFAVMGQIPTVAAPTGLATNSGAGAGQITVNWNAVSGAQTYILQRSTSASGGFVTVATVNAPATTYTDSDPNLSAGVTYYYQVAVTTAQGTSLPSAAVAGTPLVPAGIQGWRYRYFGSAGLNPSDANGASDTANPAHDGINNLLKYALGLDPTVNYYTSGASGLPIVQEEMINGVQYLTLTFTGAATDVTYTVQGAGVLTGSWTTLATFSGPSAVGTVTVRDSQPVSAASRRFLRLQISEP